MKKLLFVLQIFFKISLIFLICFIWLKYFLNSLLLSLILSSIITFVVYLGTYLIKKRKSHNQTLKIGEKEDAENIFLSLSSSQNKLDFYFQLIKSRHSSVELKKDYLLIPHKDGSKVVLFPFIKFQLFSADSLMEIINKVNQEKMQKLIILCYDYDKNSIILAKNFDFEIVLLNRFETFSKLYKEYDFYPEITIKYKKDAKLTFKDLIAFSFNKSRTKGYVFAALILLLSSFFVKANIYYCIISSLLLLFALISYINPKYNIRKNSELI